ncbi:hypothetical protein QQ054_14985 [Oscillatoria amoena NRMC-F 0135]|nr:hypothetical protein [Oscillatoria amoena NRMC-F 0135]
MTAERLTWDEIQQQFDQQWVELIDYDWPEGDYHPQSGVVRTHGADKRKFHQECRREPLPDDSAYLFIGTKSFQKDGVFIVPSLVRFEPCEQ